MIRRRHSERGFMLLFVLLVAAGIAISLYMELPRVAFETQRNREELLVQRGKQYQRAIGLYLKKFNHYPAKMEDLENTNNLRFLRRRYVDPMTGKDDWRIVHAGPGGMLTDSLVKRNPVAGTQTGPSQGMGPGMQQNAALNPGGSLNANPGLSDQNNNNNTDPNQPQEVNPAVMRRASDRSLAGNTAGAPPLQGPDPNLQAATFQRGQFVTAMPGEQTQVGPDQGGQPGQPPLNQPQGVTGEQPGAMGQPQVPGQPQPVPGQPLPPGYPQRPGLPPGLAGIRPGLVPGQLFQAPANMQAGFSQQPQPTDQSQQPVPQPNQPQAPTSAFNNSGPGNAGIQAVQNQLSGGLSGGGNSAFNNNNSVGGGIAGVASKYKGPSIKIYDEQQRYEKWEFIYDPKKDTALNKNLPQQQAVANPGNSVGQSSSFNNNSSTFNNSGGAQPPPAPPPPTPPQQ
jgi:type II secretory pathway pseudopilin PulG